MLLCYAGNACISDSCQNGATCYNMDDDDDDDDNDDDDDDFECFCAEGYWGEFCSHDSNSEDDPCEREDFCGYGQCVWSENVAGPDKAYCECDPGYSDRFNCRKGFAEFCDPSPCDFGECKNLVNDNNDVFNNYTCICNGSKSSRAQV